MARARLGLVWHRKAGMAGHVEASRGTAGADWLGEVGRGLAGQVRTGWAWHGRAGQGKAVEAGYVLVTLVKARQAWNVEAG